MGIDFLVHKINICLMSGHFSSGFVCRESVHEVEFAGLPGEPAHQGQQQLLALVRRGGDGAIYFKFINHIGRRTERSRPNLWGGNISRGRGGGVYVRSNK